MSLERARGERFASPALPLTWEPPVLVTAFALLLTAFTPLCLQGAVVAARGGGFAWPDHAPAAFLAMLRGDFGAGLTPTDEQLLPELGWMVAGTFLAEALVLGSLWVVVAWCRDLLGHGSTHGLATSGQAEDALGLGALRRRAPVVRPDLFTTASPWERRLWRWSRHPTRPPHAAGEPR